METATKVNESVTPTSWNEIYKNPNNFTKFQSNVNQTLDENQSNVSQTSNKRQSNIMQSSDKRAEISLLYFGKISSKIKFIENNTTNLNYLTEILELKKVSKNALDNKEIEKQQFLLKKLKNYANKIDGANKSRELKPKFDKKEHYLNNLLAIKFLTNRKFIKSATKKMYKSFSKLPKYIPSPIVLEINKNGITQTNGKPHTVETITYLANLHRERLVMKKIQIKKNRKILGYMILVLSFIFLAIVLFNRGEELYKLTTSIISLGTKSWNVSEIIETVKLYQETQNIEVTEWRTGKILEVTENQQLTENELIFKIDSIVKFKYK